MNKYIVLIISLGTICFAIFGGLSMLSDVFTVNHINQEALSGDTTNATKDTQQFAVDKTKEAANDIAVGAIFAVILEVSAVIGGIIGGIIVFLKGLGLL
jgi:hypothetical protein